MTGAFADGSGGSEQAGLPGGTAERPRVLVVHFADEQAAAPGIDLRRRRPLLPELGRMELKVLNAAHLRHERGEAVRERRTAFEHEPEQHEPEVAVDRLRPRWIFERERADRPLELV